MTTKDQSEIIKQREGDLFGLATKRDTSRIVILPVPWDVTTSYGKGTSLGPEAILQASPQVDLFDLELRENHREGFHLEPFDPWFKETNALLRPIAEQVIQEWDTTGEYTDSTQPARDQINRECSVMVKKVYDHTVSVLKENKIPGLIGGDHSTPLGAIKAVTEWHQGEIGILHIDAHADLRLSYQGFVHSHASIMRNVFHLKMFPQKLVQVGIRDFCREEYEFIRENEGRITTFFDRELKSSLFDGKQWTQLCEDIVAQLPKKVYISFDVDGLSPHYCPHTGTPVPGGLTYDEAMHLLKYVVHSGRQIIGFDLNEVAPGPEGDQWDGNVGARILFQLCGRTIASHKIQG